MERGHHSRSFSFQVCHYPIFIGPRCVNHYHTEVLNRILLKIGNLQSTKSTLIHGISGFLVLCYSECTRISLLLLTFTFLNSTKSGKCKKRIVPFYNGEMDYFGRDHLPYALPALLIFLLLGILPPLLLISYPLCYKVLALLKLSESRLSKILCTVIPLERFRPFFDTFQSSFRNGYRFFSGFYFLYRLIALLVFSVQNDMILYYSLIQILLLTILVVHAVCQPHKKRLHNVLDLLLFMNLSTINCIALYNYYLSQFSPNSTKIATVVQVMLLYLPLICAMFYSIKKIFQFAKGRKFYKRLRHLKTNSEFTGNPDDYHELSFSLSDTRLGGAT